MDFGTILALITKGLQLIPVLVQAGEDVAPVVNNLIKLSQDAGEGTVTEEQVTALEAQLDAMIAEFNEPME